MPNISNPPPAQDCTNTSCSKIYSRRAGNVGHYSPTYDQRLTDSDSQVQITEGVMEYRRARIAGGCYFFTVALADRSSDLLIAHIDTLRAAFKAVKASHPFTINAIVILPEHLHCPINETPMLINIRRLPLWQVLGWVSCDYRCDYR